MGVVHPHDRISFSLKREGISATWTDLDAIMLSERSQSERTRAGRSHVQRGRGCQEHGEAGEKLLFTEDRVSVWGDDKVLETEAGAGRTPVRVCSLPPSVECRASNG